MNHTKLNWLRAGVLGANDGIISISVLLVSIVGILKHEQLIIVGFSGVLAGALSMAIGEYISVSTQRDTEEAADFEQRTNPSHAAFSSFLSFVLGAVLPLTAALLFENPILIVIAVILSFLITTIVSVSVGKTKFWKPFFRNIIGGSIALTLGIILNSTLASH